MTTEVAKRDRTQEFAQTVGIDKTWIDQDIHTLYISLLAGTEWRKVLSLLLEGEKGISAQTASLIERSLPSNSTESDEDMSASSKYLKTVFTLLKNSSLSKQTSSSFFPRFTQIDALRTAFLSSPRYSKKAEKWTPLDATQAFFIAMHSANYAQLWAEHQKDNSPEATSIIKAYRAAQKKLDIAEFSELLAEFVAV